MKTEDPEATAYVINTGDMDPKMAVKFMGDIRKYAKHGAQFYKVNGPPSTGDHCREIFREILRRCNETVEKDPSNPTGMTVGFGPDWGGNSFTLYMDGSHTHVGGGDTFEGLIEVLHKRLVNDEGLSLAIPMDKMVRVNPDDKPKD